jgi:TonB family protein
MHPFITLCVLAGLCASIDAPARTHDQIDPAVLSPDDSSIVRTGDTLDGVKYYIKIVPHDTSSDEQMPTYAPREDQVPDFVPVDSQPAILKRVEPEYPEEARRLRIQGTVWVRCLVGTDGRVRKAIHLRADSEILVEPAIAAAKQWVFSPATLHGEPVSVWVSMPFRFKLDR